MHTKITNNGVAVAVVVVVVVVSIPNILLILYETVNIILLITKCEPPQLFRDSNIRP